jgi:predicted acylesterase/phospholipase RssA
VEIDGEHHVDGVFLDNLPARPAHQLAGGPSIAVNIVPRVDPLKADILANSPVLRTLIRAVLGQVEGGEPLFFNALLRSFFLPTIAAAEQLRDEVDLLIEPPLEGFAFLDLSAFDEIIERGRTTAERQLDAWLKRTAA